MLIVKARTVFRLGLKSIFRVIRYRVCVKLGINAVTRLTATVDTSKGFFLPSVLEQTDDLDLNSNWLEEHSYFGWFKIKSDSIPKWHSNCFNSKLVSDANKPWWLLPDFDSNLGDIKTVWEASRFDWVISFAQSSLQGNIFHLEKLNLWLTDWLEHNPPYVGPNWKCGQEASIRVMHLAVASLLLGQQHSAPIGLQQLIAAHLKRIAPTIDYAIGQDNNHGTSEAAALFIGGSWLTLYNHPFAPQWQKVGRKWLENRARYLIDNDGSFSQYSAIYHRVMLDTYSFSEIWRVSLSQPPFSKELQTKLSAATRWLFSMPGIEYGDVVNVGANDGARLIPLADCDYRDCRPSIQLAAALFLKKRAFSGDGIWNVPLKWFKVPVPNTLLSKPISQQFDNGGYAVLRRNDAAALIKYPRFRFRPSQADSLHLDFWLGDCNILRDGGSYSYNTSPEKVLYFSGAKSHNTVEFDNRNQMPKISRFLFGEWLETSYLQALNSSGGCVNFSAGYIDYKGACHKRSITLSDHLLTVIDQLDGFKEHAVIRWRLIPSDWTLLENSLTNGKIKLNIKSESPFTLKLSEGQESRYYLQSSNLPVLEIHTTEPGTFIMELLF